MKFIIVLLASVIATFAARANDLASEVLCEINLARTAPQQYAGFVAERAPAWRGSEGPQAAREAVRFLEKMLPVEPLAWSVGISQAALCHVLDRGAKGARGHYGSSGESPWKRMARFGQWEGTAAENISYGWRDARSIVVSLIIDDGVRGRGHRKNLFSPNFGVAGVAAGSHSRAGSICVMDFAGSFTEAGTQRVAARMNTLSRPLRSGMSFF